MQALTARLRVTMDALASARASDELALCNHLSYGLASDRPAQMLEATRRSESLAKEVRGRVWSTASVPLNAMYSYILSGTLQCSLLR